MYSSNMAAASRARKWGTLLTSPPRQLKTRFSRVTVAVPVRIQFSFCDLRLLVLLCYLRFCCAVGILLAVTTAKYCDFVVWSPGQVHIERVVPCPSYAENIGKLKNFYFREVLPRLAHGP